MNTISHIVLCFQNRIIDIKLFIWLFVSGEKRSS